MRELATAVVERLRREHGSPRLNNKDDPLDELFFILLSQMTTGPSYERVFDRLKTGLDGWDNLLETSTARLRSLIADAGLANQKAPRFIAIAKRLHRDFGAVTLSPLVSLSSRTIEAYLTSLPGVGTKTAKCVMMFSMSRRVLPVDTHVERVARRLGLLAPQGKRSRLHADLEAVVPPRLRYAFHVNAIAHGRSVCRARSPRCGACTLSALCRSGAGVRTA
jgi:endonuclease III